MAYTTTQQSRIDTATTKVASAKAAYDTAQAQSTEAERVMNDWWGQVFQCKGYQGKIKNKEILDPNECQSFVFDSNYPQCQTKNTCQARVRAFNNAFNIFKAKQADADGKKTTYDTAKSDLDGVLNAIAKESNNDPAVIISNNELKAQQDISQSILKSKNVQIAIFAVVALIIVGVMIAILKR